MFSSFSPVPIARNIRHLPCITRRSNEKGLCMFAMDCLKFNGTNLGTCIDRFYFGSCCRVPDKTVLTQFIGNNIEDNSIDSANFVHPHIEEKEPGVIIVPGPYGNKKTTTTTTTTTTEKIETTVTEKSETVEDRTDAVDLETKSDEHTIIDNKIDDEAELTTPNVVEITPKPENKITEAVVTEMPIKLSTYQSVSSGSSNQVTNKPETENDDVTLVTTPAVKPKPTRRPVRPTYKPPQKPYNTTRPQYTFSTFKPRPVKPVFNTTRKPPYRPGTKRPTKKPLPIPPRLNITILPQATSSKPVYARPSYVSITYINTTVPTTQSTTTTTPIPSTKPTTTEIVTEKVIEPITTSTEVTTEVEKTTDKPTTSFVTETTEANKETTVDVSEATEATSSPAIATTTETEVVTETEAPTSPLLTTSTESIKEVSTTPEDVATKEPERVTESDASKPLVEFTVNVTLSPTIPTTTSSVGLTTFSSVSSDNVTESATVSNSTEALKPTQETTTLPDMSDYKSVCGRRLWEGPKGRIVGGSNSGFGQWPWQISLRQYRTSTYLHKCGAALLNENWAITAAHCVEHVPPSEILVRLGEHDLAQSDEPYGFVERRVQIVASHPHFDPATFEYDLALLRFYEPVTFQPNILPICVPDNDDDYVGQTAYVTGWGRLFDEGPLPSVLQEVQVPIINNTACEAMYQAAGYNEHIPNIFICAGRSKGGADSCEGDSGGPMVLRRQRDDRFVLGGIISWGIGCAEPNQPGVYTRISEFRDWINQILLF
ncbi:unnamed protein product [Arctia plantaginis]|uniref:Peptidase S1 domain-containing protein n=1 Tax=Arctia plantaginis TaxID=874455 RepID=A0A8S1BI37_ARCPL|nr:unnamed protein product [Arctia plantaginis]